MGGEACHQVAEDNEGAGGGHSGLWGAGSCMITGDTSGDHRGPFRLGSPVADWAIQTATKPLGVLFSSSIKWEKYSKFR